eukprot:gene31603-6798_t
MDRVQMLEANLLAADAPTEAGPSAAPSVVPVPAPYPIPRYYIWISKISFFTYAYSALVQSELTGLYLEDEEGTWVEAITHLPSQIDNGLSIGINVVVLLCLMIAMELGKLGSLHAARWLRII